MLATSKYIGVNLKLYGYRTGQLSLPQILVGFVCYVGCSKRISTTLTSLHNVPRIVTHQYIYNIISGAYSTKGVTFPDEAEF